MATDPQHRVTAHPLVTSSESFSATPAARRDPRLARTEPLRGAAARRARRQARFDEPYPPLWRRLLSITELGGLLVVLGVVTALLIGAAAVAVLLVGSHLVTT